MRYFCFDSALNEVYTLLLLQKEYPTHVSLFSGTKDEQLWHVAPWIFEIGLENIYEKWKDPNCHLNRCLIIDTPISLTELKEHLQQFIYKEIDQKTYYNRFWDATILLHQLEKMNKKQLLDFFESIKDLYIKHENEYFKLTVDSKDRLIKQTIASSLLFSNEVPTTIQDTPEESDETKEIVKPKRRFFTD